MYIKDTKSKGKDGRWDSLVSRWHWMGQVLDLGTGARGMFLLQMLKNETVRCQDILS
jgi:hypothetical protein